MIADGLNSFPRRPWILPERHSTTHSGGNTPLNPLKHSGEMSRRCHLFLIHNGPQFGWRGLAVPCNRQRTAWAGRPLAVPVYPSSVCRPRISRRLTYPPARKSRPSGWRRRGGLSTAGAIVHPDCYRSACTCTPARRARNAFEPVTNSGAGARRYGRTRRAGPGSHQPRSR